MRLLASLLLTACALPAPELEVADQTLLRGCDDPDFCGTNSGLMTHYGTWEFNVNGVRNGQGLQVLGLGKGADFYQLVVEGSRIIGLDKSGNVALQDKDLVGARIYLDRWGRQSAIEIIDAGTIHELVAPEDPLGAYVLDWGVVAGNPLPGPMYAGQTIEGGLVPVLAKVQPVCPEPKWIHDSYVGSMPEWDETYYVMTAFQSVVFEGDRFDPETRTVKPYAENEWFNIGCGAHTLAKLRLTRNTINTSPDWRYVQAALKMLGADYCGTGKSFTFPGEPLVWRDRTAMSYRNMSSKHDLDARWDENGATCMYSPRLGRTNNPDAAAAYPDVWQAIEKECDANGKRKVDKCNDWNPVNWDGELVTSANYD
jgi:hypothetical protein